MKLRFLFAAVAATAATNAYAADSASLEINAEIAKVCSFVSAPGPLLIDGGTGSLTAGMKATGNFTYQCNYNNGPLRVDISSDAGALQPDQQALDNGGSAIAYGICVRGPVGTGVDCASISNYAAITAGVTQYQTIAIPGFGAPTGLVTATASYGFELQNAAPVSVAGTWSDVVHITLVP